MGWVEDLQGWVNAEFSGGFKERDGRVVPDDDVGAGQAVTLDATFLYADLAGSSDIAKHCHWATTASIIRAFLECSTRLIRAYGGHIRSFDGDRVMAVFIGNAKEGKAANCAREIFHTVDQIIGPSAAKRYPSFRNAQIKLKCGIGVDTGTAHAVRAGIRHNSDLIWVGTAPSLAAKLSDIRDYPNSVFITDRVYKQMSDQSKQVNGKDVWVATTVPFAGENVRVYKTSWLKTP